ncbi:AAA-domain-containing protein [Hypomontagnella monticulosa]|nr:AAA-domain-containing protein [Hypomontagnella monticulosa]
MWPTSSVSSLQKTYDEAYLKCSTAVYYESQGDEKEAMSCWKNALDQIRQNPTNKKQGNNPPKSETERALLDSLRELEVQCKERIDLLEALRISREEDQSVQLTQSSIMSEGNTTGRSNPNTPERGWIGDGTIPAITYTELSKPPLPKRPSFPSRSSSEQAIVGGLRSAIMDQDLSSSATRPPSLPPYGVSTPRRRSSRSPSPEKHTMRTTLRSSRPEKSSKSSHRTPAKISKGPGASKAATLAWSNLEKGTSADTNSSPSKLPEPWRSREQTRKSSASTSRHWDSHTRRLVFSPEAPAVTPTANRSSPESSMRNSNDYMSPAPSSLALGAASSALGSLAIQERDDLSPGGTQTGRRSTSRRGAGLSYDESNNSTIRRPEFSESSPRIGPKEGSIGRKPVGHSRTFEPNSARKRVGRQTSDNDGKEEVWSSDDQVRANSSTRKSKGKQKETPITSDTDDRSPGDSTTEEGKKTNDEWETRKKAVMKNLPPGIDEAAAKAIFNEIVVQGDEVHWSDVAGLDIAKNALKEAVVYPFLRPDLFMGLREPARGMLLFGPPGTGKTMLARAVATESKSTFFSISASSLTSKYLGESEKLVRALFALAKMMAPSIIFVDEIDSLLSQRSGSGEHEATRRIKTEFLIQWSDLQRAAAGRESNGANKERGDPNRVLVLAATNLPWAIDEAARRRFVRRQYIPLPEAQTRATQLKTLLGQQKHSLTDTDIAELVDLTDGFSGSDITALAKDAAMGPLRALGEALLHMTMDQIRPIELADFKAALKTIRPSVSREGLKEYEDWARRFGERGG